MTLLFFVAMAGAFVGSVLAIFFVNYMAPWR